MFENLKAFIRHGKQANDMRKKPLEESMLVDTANEITYNVSDPEAAIAFDVKEEGVGSNHMDEMALKEREDAYVARMKESNGRESDNYHQVASHIVEQEKLQRMKSTKYPNLDNYEILEKMGEGAFSVVYKARHLKTDKYVAIKVLRKFQMDQAQKQSVLKEVTIMRQLDHPNIVKFIEFIDSDKYYYIVQELAFGGEIFTAIVKFTYFSEDLSRHVISQVAHAIRYLHEEVGIVHRDIKPENLLYMPIDIIPSADPAAKLRKSDDKRTKEDEGEFIPTVGGGSIGLVKIADFGLSKQIWEHNTKTPCGTVGYTAPEIVRDERYSKEVDMWAIGCVLYTLLCGFPPFYDERIETLTEKVARGEYTFLSPWWDEISQEAKYCVSRLLTVDPNKRYTIDEFLRDPWVTNAKQQSVTGAPVSNQASIPVKPKSKNYKNKFSYNNDLYSPAVTAMRDAFDISTAVHRMEEEAALASRNIPKKYEDLVEEDEEEDEKINVISGKAVNDVAGAIPRRRQKHAEQPRQATNLFDLNLKGASILERRKNKNLVI